MAGTGTIRVGGNWANSGTSRGPGPSRWTGTTAAAPSCRAAPASAASPSTARVGTYTLSDRLWVPGGTLTLTNGTLDASTFTARIGTVSFRRPGRSLPGTGTLDHRRPQQPDAAALSSSRRAPPRHPQGVRPGRLLEAGRRRRRSRSTTPPATATSGPSRRPARPGPTSVASAFSFDNPSSVAFNGTRPATTSRGRPTCPPSTGPRRSACGRTPTSTGRDPEHDGVPWRGGRHQLGMRGGTLYVWS